MLYFFVFLLGAIVGYGLLLLYNALELRQRPHTKLGNLHWQVASWMMQKFGLELFYNHPARAIRCFSAACNLMTATEIPFNDARVLLSRSYAQGRGGSRERALGDLATAVIGAAHVQRVNLGQLVVTQLQQTELQE